MAHPSLIELCAGGGGQALGLEMAGFDHLALVEIERAACDTLRRNRPHWHVLEQDLRTFSGSEFFGADMVAGGVPCPPFSIAGKQLGADDERDLFMEALRVVEEVSPRVVMLENVRGILSDKFKDYRQLICSKLAELGYFATWKLVNASDYGVPQLRPRAILVALRHHEFSHFRWPLPLPPAPTVGEALKAEMASAGWPHAEAWARNANAIAPTIVGGSKKHGGPDLGPTRARQQWLELGVTGTSLAEFPPEPDFVGKPRLTIPMVAKLQGFPASWHFAGSKTHAYRQVGNAFPPPVAAAIGRQILAALQLGQVQMLAG